VGTAVAVGAGVSVGTAVAVGAGVSVGAAVTAGAGVSVGTTVAVGAGVPVAVGFDVETSVSKGSAVAAGEGWSADVGLAWGEGVCMVVVVIAGEGLCASVAVAIRGIVGVGKDAMTSVLCTMVNVGLGVRVGLAVGIEGAQAPRNSKAAAAQASFIPLFTVHRLPSEALYRNKTATLWLRQRPFGKQSSDSKQAPESRGVQDQLSALYNRDTWEAKNTTRAFVSPPSILRFAPQ